MRPASPAATRTARKQRSGRVSQGGYWKRQWPIHHGARPATIPGARKKKIVEPRAAYVFFTGILPNQEEGKRVEPLGTEIEAWGAYRRRAARNSSSLPGLATTRPEVESGAGLEKSMAILPRPERLSGHGSTLLIWFQRMVLEDQRRRSCRPTAKTSQKMKARSNRCTVMITVQTTA